MKYKSHLILDLKECKKTEKLSNKKFIENFLIELSKIIKMKAITKPNVLYYNHRKKEKSGITGFIIIADSHISIHTYPLKKSLYCDLFSCKKFDSKQIVDYIKEVFEPENFIKRLIRR